MQESALTWEAFRLTSKSPSELMTILGPHGVDNLVRQALATCWRELPGEERSLPDAKKAAQEAFDRNIRHWSSIKKASPGAFFENLAPHAADQYFRQALVLCHMMLPRGKRALADVRRIVTDIYNRNIEAWEEDHRTLSGAGAKRTARPAASRGNAKVKSKPKPKRSPKKSARRARK